MNKSYENYFRTSESNDFDAKEWVKLISKGTNSRSFVLVACVITSWVIGFITGISIIM